MPWLRSLPDIGLSMVSEPIMIGDKRVGQSEFNLTVLSWTCLHGLGPNKHLTEGILIEATAL